MNLSDIVTEDGVALVEGGKYCTIRMNCFDVYIVAVLVGPLLKSDTQAVYLTNENNRQDKNPIVNGRAVGLWASRATLEAGLGRGA